VALSACKNTAIDKLFLRPIFKEAMELTLKDRPLEQILHKPLIIGASVSADHLSASPGKRLALQYTNKQNIRTIAHGGYPGKDIIKMIHESDLKDRTVVIGMDLFFWDSTLDSPHQSLNALHHLVELINKHKLPLILGDIPELLPGWQKSRKLLQDEIHRICHVNDLCILMPLEHLYKDVLKDGFISYQGRQYNLWDLVPDGLHIGDVAGNYLSEAMLNVLNSSRSA
jgi:hypothetical protein